MQFKFPKDKMVPKEFMQQLRYRRTWRINRKFKFTTMHVHPSTVSELKGMFKKQHKKRRRFIDKLNIKRYL